jgi:hypothetical protein
MRNRNIFLTPVLMTCIACAISNLAQESGSIRGTVVDEHGAPVGGTKVNASPEEGRPGSIFIRYVETDSRGRFKINGLTWGRYKLFAKNEAVGYPDMRWAFYSDDKYPTVVLSPAAPEAEVRFQLGPKAAILRGCITNLLTGAPLDAAFKLTRAAPPNKWISTSVAPNYRVLLPPSTDILLEVTAPGFGTWTSPHPLRLQPGSETRLNISLEPSHDPSLHPSKFLIPDGYTGWLLLEYKVKDGRPVPIENGVKIFKFPSNGVLNTSSPGPERGAEDEYLFYFPDGSLHEICADYRNGKGMIWGKHEGSKGGIMDQFGFFIGTEEQFKKYRSRITHPGSIPAP